MSEHHERLGFAQRVEQEAHATVKSIEQHLQGIPHLLTFDRKRLGAALDKVSNSILQLGETMREATTALEQLSHRLESLDK